MSTIREIFLVLALLLLIAGTSVRSWVLSEQKKEQQLLYQQQEQFKIKVAEADKVLAKETNIKPLSSDTVAEGTLPDELANHQENDTARSDILTVSIICIAAGVTIFAGWLLSLVVYSVSVGLRYLKKFFADISKHLRKFINKWPIKTFFKKSKKLAENKPDKIIKIILTGLMRLKKYLPGIFKYLKQALSSRLSKIFLKKTKDISQKQHLTEINKLKECLAIKNEMNSDYSEKDREKIEMLYCDKKVPSSEEQINLGIGGTGLNAKLLDQMELNIRKTILSGYHQNALNVQSSIKAQNENLEKQVGEVMQMAQTIKEAAARNSEPVRNSLDELAKQVSAIREYTSFQQDKIEKLQQGYDWNIIRTFCLRVIRCIDNLENRIVRLNEQNIDTADLEEIMDELIFVLESSGVEQFKPDINTDYNGKERIAEVVKDRICTDDQNMKGKIAEVVQPGYQYVIDDSNTKVVRAARVKLFS